MRDFLLKLAFAALDRWLDGLVDRQAWEADKKAHAKLIAAKLLSVLEPIVGDFAKDLVPLLTKRALARAFPNDPSTGNWG